MINISKFFIFFFILTSSVLGAKSNKTIEFHELCNEEESNECTFTPIYLFTTYESFRKRSIYPRFKLGVGYPIGIGVKAGFIFNNCGYLDLDRPKKDSYISNEFHEMLNKLNYKPKYIRDSCYGPYLIAGYSLLGISYDLGYEYRFSAKGKVGMEFNVMDTKNNFFNIKKDKVYAGPSIILKVNDFSHALGAWFSGDFGTGEKARKNRSVLAALSIFYEVL